MPDNPVCTFAIASDYSAIIPTPDGFGSFRTERAALDRQIEILAAEIRQLTSWRRTAERRRKGLIKT